MKKVEELEVAQLMIEQEELKQVQEANEKLKNITMSVGQLELEKTFAITEYHRVNAEFNSLREMLQDKYGKISINVQDGSYTVDE